MHFLWVSNSPFAPSGYGVQSRLQAKALRSLGHTVTFFAFHRDKDEPVSCDGSKILGHDGFTGLTEVATFEHPDVIVFLGDAWEPDRWRRFEALKERVPSITQFWTYCPVDCEPLSSAEVPLYDLADAHLAMSPHTTHMLDSAEYGPIHPIPHAIDLDEWTVDPESRPESLQSSLIVGMVQANVGTRKLIPLQLEAFSIAAKVNPWLRLAYHGDISGESHPYGVDLRGLPTHFGIADKAFATDDPDLNQFYNRIDLLLQCTSGEGFGVPVVEAAACGVPCVVTDNSALQYFEWALRVPTVVKEFVPDQMAFRSWPSPPDVADAILSHFDSPQQFDPDELRDEASWYDWRRVADDWNTAIAALVPVTAH